VKINPVLAEPRTAWKRHLTSFVNYRNSHQRPDEISGLMTVECWLDERGHSLVPLSNPGSDPEVSLESGGHGTLLGR